MNCCSYIRQESSNILKKHLLIFVQNLRHSFIETSQAVLAVNELRKVITFCSFGPSNYTLCVLGTLANCEDEDEASH